MTLLFVYCVIFGLETERRWEFRNGELSLSGSVTFHPLLGLLMFLHGSSCNHCLRAACTEEGRGADSEEIVDVDIWRSFFELNLMLGFVQGGHT